MTKKGQTRDTKQELSVTFKNLYFQKETLSLSLSLFLTLYRVIDPNIDALLPDSQYVGLFFVQNYRHLKLNSAVNRRQTLFHREIFIVFIPV